MAEDEAPAGPTRRLRLVAANGPVAERAVQRDPSWEPQFARVLPDGTTKSVKLMDIFLDVCEEDMPGFKERYLAKRAAERETQR